ncbi:TonB-dependent receptor plug domain-containing protein [Thermoflexibacter ruber]|uniref:Hemoglobin/transferrin/lactoferrin receptor protein n=1 Tax=Thermoflexibacter ruber TaxID=1003 RepID=A0A1I2BQK7_9BACT|nr:TonB-dependent receptor [Thermoflexibacter ruber]SFE58401.1 hemoglobin/transferrin/lactoferrin receptor protein [Thermoflexibacter ruber]
MKLKIILLTKFIFFYTLIFAQNSSNQGDSIFAKMDRLGIDELIQGKAITEEKIVGASRSVKKLEDLPITVYVITQEDILKNGYTTLVDVLKMVPGIRVSKPGSGIFGEAFLLRGLEGNVYTKILLNNLPIQPSSNSALSIGEQLPIAQVDRIEVIYGPSSAVYGADAMAGVINIITKSTQSSTFAQANALAGQYGYRHVNFMAGGKLGKNKNVIHYNIYANRGVRADQNIKHGEYKKLYSPLRQIEELENLSDAELQAIVNDPRFDKELGLFLALQSPYYSKDGYVNAPLNELPQESYLLGFSLNYRGLQLSFNEMYREDHSSIGRRPFYFGYQNPENRIGQKMQITSLNYTTSWDKFTFTSNLMYLKERYDKYSSLATNYSNEGKSYIYQASDDIFGEAVVNYNLSKKIELTGGVSYKLSSALPQTNDLASPFNPSDYKPFTGHRPPPDPLLGNFGINPTSFNNFGAFIQGYYSSKRWNIVFGWRYDNPSNYSDQSYNRIAVMYKLTNKTSLRLSGGYAFKAPALSISYNSVAFPDREIDFTTGTYGKFNDSISYQVVPSPNLAPEELGAIDFGLRYAINTNTYLDVSGFVNSVSNLIVAFLDTINRTEYPKATGGLVRSYRNEASTLAALTGFQVALRARDLIPAIGLNTNFAYTYQFGFEDLGGDLTGRLNEYRQVPRHTLQWNISLNPLKKLYLNFDNVAMSGWYRKYIDTDLDIGRELFKNFIKGYYTLDMTARYTFNKNISSFLKIINVFDAQYGGLNATGFDVDMKYTPQLGRNIQIGISFKME